MNEKIINSNSDLKVSKAKEFIKNRVVIAYLLVIAIFIIGGIIVPNFLTFNHIMTVLQASFFIGLISLGQTIVVISGQEGLDLSVGGMFVIGIVLSAAITNGLDRNLPLAFIAVVAAGFILGLVNGVGVAFLKIAPLIMTLAWGIAILGIALFTTKGVHIGRASPLLEVIGIGSLRFSVGGYEVAIPWVLVVWLGIIILAVLIMRRTTIGHILYGIGSNDQTAKMLGIRTKIIRMMAYSFSGIFSAIAGMIMLGYVYEPNINLGTKYVLPSAVAVIIGGVSFGGGAGSYLGAVAGAIFLTTLEGILATRDLGEGGRQLVMGIVLIILLATYGKKRKRI